MFLLNRKHDLNKVEISVLYKSHKMLLFFIKILVSIMDQISIYKWHIIYAENANYLLCFQDKTSIKLFLMVLNTVLKNEITFH